MKKLMAGSLLVSAVLAATPLLAHPGAMGGGMGPGAMGGSQQGMQGQMQHGMRVAQGPQAAQQLMTAEERTALQEKMRNAKTPEERQQIAAATRTEMQKRAAEKGITLPEHRGPRGRAGAGPNVTAPESNEHVH